MTIPGLKKKPDVQHIEDVQSYADTRQIPIKRVAVKDNHHPVRLKDRSGREQHSIAKAMLNKSSRVGAPWFGMGCKAQTTAIAQLWRGFATPQTAQNRDDRAARDLFSVALTST